MSCICYKYDSGRRANQRSNKIRKTKDENSHCKQHHIQNLSTLYFCYSYLKSNGNGARFSDAYDIGTEM